jgi:hypothetical protein
MPMTEKPQKHAKKKSGKAKIARFHIRLADGTSEDLEELSTLLKRNKTDAVRLGLTLALAIARAKEKGHRIIIEAEDGTQISEIVVPKPVVEVVVPIAPENQESAAARIDGDPEAYEME